MGRSNPSRGQIRLAPARFVKRGRKIQMCLMERTERLIKGGIMARPVWYDAALAHPPPPQFHSKAPKELTFPLEELRRTWLRRNPAASMTPKPLFLEEKGLASSHPGDLFVERQRELMQNGMDEEAAYRQVLAEQQRQEKVDALDAQSTLETAQSLGASADL